MINDNPRFLISINCFIYLLLNTERISDTLRDPRPNYTTISNIVNKIKVYKNLKKIIIILQFQLSLKMVSFHSANYHN